MKLHTDKITREDMFRITEGIPGVYAEATQHGSRSRARAFNLHLVADQRKGRRRSNSGHYGAGDDYAAAWDEWGIVFARLYAIDPKMTCWAYDSAKSFHWQTDGRFQTESFTPHDQHRFRHDGINGEQACKCGAVRRWAVPS